MYWKRNYKQKINNSKETEQILDVLKSVEKKYR